MQEGESVRKQEVRGTTEDSGDANIDEKFVGTKMDQDKKIHKQ